MIVKEYSAGGIVLNNKGEIALANTKGNYWSLPKGHIDPGEDAYTAALRELYEETGIVNPVLVKPLGVLTRHMIKPDGTYHPERIKDITFFLFTSDQEVLVPVDPMHPEARWFSKEEALTLISHPKDKEFVAKVFSEL
ncbi:MAG: NUDIX domain-containing protein [bacterium]|nr:NUDIX domain-containing protein [bacterium]